MRSLPLFLIFAMLVIAVGIEVRQHHLVLWQSKLPLAIALAIAFFKKNSHAG